jgi:molecular chaperone GrpE
MNKNDELNTQNEYTEVVLDLKKKIEDLQNLLNDEREYKLRAIADYQNQKRQFDKQIEELSYFANKSILNSLMELYDDSKRAEEHDGRNKSQNINQQLLSKLYQIISSQNIVEIEVKIGDEFDPEVMEAITTQIVDNERLVGKVILIVQSGFKYALNNRIVRPVRVIVGSK